LKGSLEQEDGEELAAICFALRGCVLRELEMELPGAPSVPWTILAEKMLEVFKPPTHPFLMEEGNLEA
jgi:hypothetical protein